MTLIDIKTKEDLLKLKRDLKKQFAKDKFMEQDLYDDVKKVYKPLIEPLTKMAEETKQTRQAIKDAPREMLAIKAVERMAIGPPELKKPVGPTALSYLSKAFKYGSEYDRAYGIKFDGERAMLGDKIVNIQGNDIVIDDEVFDGTVGLWELITKQKPENYNAEDLQIYLQILRQAKPHLRSDGIIKANRGEKFYKFIQPLYKAMQKEKARLAVDKIRAASPSSYRDSSPDPRGRTPTSDLSKSDYESSSEVSGSGIVVIPSNVNDIVSKHHLLFGSLNAGNTGVFNELQALTHELYKRNLLDDHDVKRLNKYCLRKWNRKA